MKNHIKILMAALLCSVAMMGQSEEEANKNKSFIPNSTPPAPEAFAMTKYGDVPIDEFNGKVNLSVPIFEYKAGMLSVPVSVNYNGAGVKVTDTPTQVGINWTLSAGGLISREIKGQPDEVVDKLTLTLTQIMALNQPDCSTEAQQLRAIIDNKNIDKENDIFNFNFLGYSGSFFLNDSFDPVLTKNDQELRIEIVGAQTDKRERLRVGKTFLITTPDGVKYYFGGADASEDTAMMIRNNGNPDLNSIGGITSFYLIKIEHPLSGTILLEYETTAPHYVPVNMNYFRVKKIMDPAVFEGLELGMGQQTCPGVPQTATSISQGDTQTQHYVANEKMVKTIYSPDTADFILFTRDEYSAAMSYKKVLKKIEFYKGITVFQKASFEYSGLAPTLNLNRFFLTKVDFNNHVTGMDAKREAYVFEYNDPSALPSIGSYSKDVLGFFNNKSNINLYPRFPEENQNYAPDRTSDFTYASKGVLQKVIYPTKGYTEFEYESQPYIEPKYTSYGLDTYYNGTGALDGEGVYLNGAYQKLHDELPGVYIDDQNQQFPQVIETVKFTQEVVVNLSCSTSNEVDPNFKPFKVKVKIIEKLNGTVVSTVEKQTGLATNFPYEFKAGHDYKIEMDLIKPTTVDSNYSARGSISFTLHTDYHAPTGYGIRLKRTKNYDAINSNPTMKRYYYKPYHKLDDIFVDSFKFNNIAKHGGYIILCQVSTSPFFEGMGTMDLTVQTETLNSNINFMDNTLVSTMRDYNCVTVSYGGDNFELGGTEKTFALADPQVGERIMPVDNNQYAGSSYLIFTENTPVSNPDPVRGQLLKEKFFSNTNGTKNKVKEIQHSFSNVVTYRKYNLTGSKFLSDISVTCNQSGGSNGRILSNYWIHYYNTNSHAFKKTAQKEINYIDPVPASLVAHEPTELEDPNAFPTQEQLEASYRKIASTQDYEYGSLRGMPTKVTTTSSDGTVQSTENVYVNQYGTLTGLTSPQTAAYAALLAQNNVASPIETKELEGTSTLLSKKRTTYQVLTGNKVVPELIQTAKASLDLEDRAVFEEYDSKGNPTLMSLKDGVKIKYLYNANNQVIAKLENFSGTLDANTNSISNACTFIGQYPTAQVSVFKYHPVTNLLIETVDPNCKKTTYEYDTLHRLQQVKDNYGNVIQAFDNNFKH